MPVAPAASTFIAESGLEIKVCIGSYKLFFVPDTEDFFARRLTVEDEEARRVLVEAASKEGKEKVEAWVDEKLGLAPPAAPAPAAVIEGGEMEEEEEKEKKVEEEEEVVVVAPAASAQEAAIVEPVVVAAAPAPVVA